MIRISSTTTIFYKLFLPIFWSVFFGAFTIALWFTESVEDSIIGTNWIRIVFTVSYLLILFLLYKTLFSLKRVEYGQDMVFVTDYFKAVKFPMNQIDKLYEKKWGIFVTAHLHLQQNGIFGDRIRFIICKTEYPGFRNSLNLPYKQDIPLLDT